MKSNVVRDSGLDRRKYYREREGGKNEWGSLVQHYEEFSKKADLMENYAKRAVYLNYQKELERQRREDEERKRKEREEELAFEREILERDHQSKIQEMRRQRAHQLSVKSLIEEDCNEQLSTKQARVEREKDEKLNYEINSLNKVLTDTDPVFIKKKLDASKNDPSLSNSRSMGYLQYRSRLKKDGDMNYQSKGVNRFEKPNILRDAYEREFRRKEDTLKFYEEIKEMAEKKQMEEREARERERMMADLDSKNNVSEYVNFMSQQKLNERQKRLKYAEELKRQQLEDLEKEKLENKMTRTEKRINYDNLQAYKVWDSNNYAYIPGWGGNARYYNQMIKSGKLSDRETVNEQVVNSLDRGGFNFASHANSNLLIKQFFFSERFLHLILKLLKTTMKY